MNFWSLITSIEAPFVRNSENFKKIAYINGNKDTLKHIRDPEWTWPDPPRVKDCRQVAFEKLLIVKEVLDENDYANSKRH